MTADLGVVPHRKAGFETLAIHAGQDPEPATGAVVVPIFQISTFAHEAVGKHKGNEYARTGNPTRAACLATLEAGAWGLAFSGIAATDAVAHLLSSGHHVVIGPADGWSSISTGRASPRRSVRADPLRGGRKVADPIERAKTMEPTEPEREAEKPASFSSLSACAAADLNSFDVG